MKTAKLLTVVIFLQGLILVGQWLGNPSFVSAAAAQIPDAGGQRLQLIDELKSLNAKVEKMSAFLESGKLEVKVVVTDDQRAGWAK